MNTEKMLETALALAGVEKCPADSGVIVPGENVKKVLAGLDINNPELALAKSMGYDCVVGHHPRTTDLKECSKLMEDLAYESLTEAGVPLIEAQKAVSGRAEKADDAKHAINHNREASAAQVLEMPFICINSPAYRIGEKTIQQDLDAHFLDKPFTPLSQVVDVIKEFPECKAWSLEPKIIIGDPKDHAGRILVALKGLSESSFNDGYMPECDDSAIMKAYFKNGIGTLVLAYLGDKEKKAIQEQKIGNVVIMGHMPMDSVGMNKIIAEWEKQGVQVDKFCGILG